MIAAKTTREKRATSSLLSANTRPAGRFTLLAVPPPGKKVVRSVNNSAISPIKKTPTIYFLIKPNAIDAKLVFVRYRRESCLLGGKIFGEVVVIKTRRIPRSRKRAAITQYWLFGLRERSFQTECSAQRMIVFRIGCSSARMGVPN